MWLDGDGASENKTIGKCAIKCVHSVQRTENARVKHGVG
jgi:hypothetical protein